MQWPPDTNPPSAVNRTPNRNAQPNLGGADAVEKTSSLGDVHGAGVNEPAQAPVEVAATVPHRAGVGPIGWIVIVLAALVLAAYAAGLFT